MEYDFKSLSDYDFELLVCDLLSEQLGRRIESFRRGRDQGVDLRYASDSGGTVVVQCKHYANTPFSGLCAAAKAEGEKIQRLRPERYVLVTSQFLSPAEKDKLLGILAPFCQSAEDILGGNEVNALLRRHPGVERAHYKLWLTSAAVLEKILHSEIYQQSVILQAEIRSKLQIYVQSKAAYSKAQEMLKQYNCCIISGIPGIGKTTLAEILLIYYLYRDYQIIKVRSDIGEALRAIQPERKQVFLYDDFLGSTFLETKGNKNESQELLSFLEYISKQRGKKVILTTREYILNQARQNYESFARENFDYKKCVISLEDYTRADRARILYNHLFFCDVSREDIADLLVEDRIIKIVDHPNYSPRLMETVIKLRRTAGEDGFYSFFSGMLDHPSQLWENAFCRQISPAARDLLLLLCPAEGPIYLTDLERCYEGYHALKSRAENRPLHTRDFMDALKETEGTFIRIDRSCVTYHNPSVRDFVHGYIRENGREFQMLCEAAEGFRDCIRLANLDPALCRKYEEPFLTALRKTAGGLVREFSLAEGIKALASVRPRLRMEPVAEVLRQMLERLLDMLEKKRGEISEDTWHEGVEPCDLKALLEGVDLSVYEPELTDRVFDVCFWYALAWFEWSFSYTPKDFLLFQTLRTLRPFPVEQGVFRRVYEALEDYCVEVAGGDIEEMDYEGDCEVYQREIEALSDLFEVDLSDIVSEVKDRIWALEQAEDGEDADEDWTDDLPFARRLEDREMLNMFQSLLERDG